MGIVGGARVTAPAVRAGKGGEPLVMVTAYDAPGARVAHQAGVEMILVGDSLAMVVLGYDDTLQVTVEDMAHHTAAVARGLRSQTPSGPANPRPLVVGDLPWMSYHTGADDAVRNAATLIRAGAECVKLEGGRKRVAVIKAIVDAEIPVMGHIGLTPQSVNALGGFKVQGKQLCAAMELLEDARALVDAGVFAIVLEAVPDGVARVITELIPVPTIGIGAGPHCDGQVLVYHDLLGIEDRLAPKFVRRYAELGSLAVDAMAAYARDVRSRAFPSTAESYATPSGLAEALKVAARGDGRRSAGPSVDIDIAAAVLSAEAEDFLAGLYGGPSGGEAKRRSGQKTVPPTGVDPAERGNVFV